MHGSVGEFDPAKEDWSTYSARLGFYFQANGVTEADRKRAILLSCSGPETFRLARSLASPRVLNDLTYKEIGDLMEAHYNPKKSEAVQRYKSQQPCTSFRRERVHVHRRTKEARYTLWIHWREHTQVYALWPSRLRHQRLKDAASSTRRARLGLMTRRSKSCLPLESAAENTSSLEKTASQATGGSDNSVHRVGRSKRPSKSHGDSSKHQEPSQDSSCYRCVRG